MSVDQSYNRRGRKVRQPGSYNYGTIPAFTGNVIPTRKPRHREQIGQEYYDNNTDQYLGQNNMNSRTKSEIINEKVSEKQKHKCKITFYLNESDFEDNQPGDENKNKEGSGETKKNMLAKIM